MGWRYVGSLATNTLEYLLTVGAQNLIEMDGRYWHQVVWSCPCESLTDLTGTWGI